MNKNSAELAASLEEIGWMDEWVGDISRSRRMELASGVREL
jgi:hypothetical protein